MRDPVETMLHIGVLVIMAVIAYMCVEASVAW